MMIVTYIWDSLLWIFHRLPVHFLPPPLPETSDMSRKLYCCFENDLNREFPVMCHDEDTYYDLKVKIQQKKGLEDDVDQWDLYRPGDLLDKTKPFIPKAGDQRLAPKHQIRHKDQESGDSDIDIVIVGGQQHQHKQPQRKDIETLAASDLPYRPPRPDALLDSPGRAWDYQVSPGLIETLRTQVQSHFDSYTKHHIDKTTIPLYLFLSGAGTGKSRNAAELHQTAYKCFSGHYFQRNEKLANLILGSFVFHVSFENGTSILPSEKDPLLAIGSRMFLQLIQDETGSLSLEDVHAKFHPPTPLALIRFFAKQTPGRAFFLIVDGLKNIQDIFGETILMQTLTALGDLAQRGFIIVCGTSTFYGPVDKILKGSRRRRVLLPCTSLEPPNINNKPAFSLSGIVEKVLVQDCGGHGRALEVLTDIIPALSRDATVEVKFLVVQRLHELYKGTLPREADALGIVRAVIANRCLERDELIPGTSVTPDEVVQNGLVRFETDGHTSSGYLKVPYIWVLVLATTYHGNPFFEELQLLEYRDFRVREDSSFPGGFSWADFECLMVKIRKIKSHVFEDQSFVTLGNLHSGAFMTDDTKSVCIRNHHLQDDVAFHQTMSQTTSSNQHQWLINTDNSGNIDLRWHRHIVRNASGAPAADAIVSLQSNPVRTECLQFKNTKEGRLNFQRERMKAAGSDDIFALFCTSSIPSLRTNGTYHVPSGTVLVVKENWQNYFGPYAGRSYLFAKEV